MTTKARALAERIRIDCCWLDHTREGGPGIDFDGEAAAELLEQYAADAREQERQACIAYADRTERMFLARAQAVADDSDRADSEAASDDEERHEMRAEGARAVAHGLRHEAHRPHKEPVAEVRRERVAAEEPAETAVSVASRIQAAAFLQAGSEIVEADRAAVREAALREAIATIEATPIGAWRKSALDHLEKLLTGGKTHG